jgi:CubicO group peptidase (beta-lactamase class C family)
LNALPRVIPANRTPLLLCALGVLAAALGACHGTPAAPDPPEAPSTELDRFVIAQMEGGRLPGLSACVIKRGGLVWSKAYGWADIGGRQPMTTDTAFQVGSISKTIVATAVMQMAEAGLVRLDEDVNAYLPFSVRNRGYPGGPITVRMLLTHTSSIKDNPSLLGSLNRAEIPLASFLQDYLVPGRRYASDSYHSTPPGAAWSYSNVGASLAAHVVERVSGKPFEDYATERILRPVGIDVASWRPGPIAGVPNAVPHVDYKAVAPDEYPVVYPGGSLRTSAPQLARFLLMFMAGGTHQGSPIVSPSSVAEMARVQLPSVSASQALLWSYTDNGRLLGHTGGLTGIGGFMFFRPADGTAVIALVNGDLNDPHGAFAARILERLFVESELL